MTQAFFRCYPWDLEDEGIEAALAAMAGDIGVDAVSVAAAYHHVSEFRSRVAAGPRALEQEAAVHFQPEARHYASTRLRPNTAARIKSRNPLVKIAHVAEAQGLKLRAWVSCCRSRSLVSRYPMAGCVDVFGDPIPGRLCPSNPDVREYVAALVEDLSTDCPVEAVELEELHFGHAAGAQRFSDIGVAPNDVERVLLSWCFCSSCRQRASGEGVDVDAVTATVRKHLEQMTSLVPPSIETLSGLLAADANIAAYHRMREDAITSLLRRVRERTNARLLLCVERPDSATGLDVRAAAPECDGLVVPYGPTCALPEDARAVEDAGGVERIEAVHCCHPPQVRDGAALVTQVHEASAAGYAGMGFFNYGIAPQPCLDWVRQAIRYAKRETA
jgi:hypothetical protein